MSTIVVVKKGGRAVIAADTLTKFGPTKVEGRYVRNRDKILHFRDTYIGIVGAATHHNVFESVIRKYPGKLSFNGAGEIFETYLQLHPIFKEEYYLCPQGEEGERQSYESNQMDSLIANPRGIFGCYAQREVLEYETFWAIGTGAEYALGAMRATYDRLETPEEIAREGVAAGCEFDENCGLPHTLYSVQLERSSRHVERTLAAI